MTHPKSRILVLGAAGMLGHKVCQQLRGHEIFGLVRSTASRYTESFAEAFDAATLLGGVDVLEGDRLEVTIRELAPAVVVNCIGLVKQLEAADDAYLAVAINSLLPHRLARLCADIGARLIHISTDCVFDGSRGAYRESDFTDARDLYGRSKALGETNSRELAAVTLRTSFIGRELSSRTHGLLEWLLAQNGGSVKGFRRVIYSGLTSLELATVIRRIIERHAGLRGVYHVASQPISKYDLLIALRETYGLDVEIGPVDEPVCDRSLLMDALSAETGYAAPAWQPMIERMQQDPTPYDTWKPTRSKS